MKTSTAGRALITKREGRRLESYRDVRGIWTIGVGHVDMTPPKVTPGMRITDAECDAMLAADLAPVEKVINTAVKVPITQNEFDALASLGFNIGVGGLKGSTVVKLLNKGDVHGAAGAFMNWSKPASLAGRRQSEKAQFLTPDAPLPHDPSPTRTIAAARSIVLKDKSSMAQKQANTAGSASVGMAVAAIVAAPVVTPHHHWLGIAIGAVVLAIAAAAGIAALIASRKAATLSTNAAAEAAVAHA